MVIPRTAPPAVSDEHRRARAGIGVFFLLHGVLVGTWAARIPDVKTALGLDDGALGLALLAGPVGTLLGLVPARILVDRFGCGRAAFWGAPAHSIAIFGPAVAWNVQSLAAALFIFGFLPVAFVVAINTGAVQVERWYGRSLMTSFHAAYSIGAAAGAVAGGIVAGLGLGLAPSFAVVAAPAILVVLAVGKWLRVLPRTGTDTPSAPATGEPGQRAIGRTELTVWLLGLLAFCAIFGDGAAEHWSAVYLHDVISVTPSLAAFGFATYSAMMIAGRLCGDRLSDRLGPVRLVRLSALLSAVGLAVALTSRDVTWVIVGFGLTGLGFSCIYPKILAATGHLDPSRAARNITRVSGIGFLGLLISPAVIGGLADRFGLANALWLPVVLALGVAASASLVRARK